ncbi:MAG: GC-type dockerin domain-anchored protein [Phycisphaerales bacterium]
MCRGNSSFAMWISVGAVALVQSALGQNLVADGGFETPVLVTPWEHRGPGTTFDAWTVDDVNNGIAQVGSYGQPSAIEGAQFVELNALAPGGISQTLATEPGRAYVLSFLMAGQLDQGPDVKSMRVDFGGATLATLDWSRTQTGGQWVRVSLCARAASGATVLHFFGLTTGDGGPYLDDVRLEPGVCPADLDDGSGTGMGDCAVTIDDLIFFLDAFGRGDVRSDLDDGSGTGTPDGGVTIDDLVYYLDHFNSGC